MLIINNKLNLLKKLIDGELLKIKLTNDLLMYCAEYGYNDMYFYLTSLGLVPNISVYNKAVLSESPKIVTDINNRIAPSSKTLNTAFQVNNTDIIKFLLTECKKENIHLDSNLVTYPILNSNTELIDFMEQNKLINWHFELYYSALLSGSIPTIKFLEEKIPNIHENRILDSSHSKKVKRHC